MVVPPKEVPKVPKIIRGPKKRKNTRRESKCQKIKTGNMKNPTTKTRNGESTKGRD
jgi:hypothetical protein